MHSTEKFAVQTVFFTLSALQTCLFSTWMSFGQNSTWKEDFWVKVATYI
jgi:hypothetical protein